MARTAASSNVAIEAVVDDKASKPLADVAQSADDADRSLTELNSAAELASKAWGALSGAIGAVVGYMRGAVASAMEAEKAQRDLATALRQHGGAVDDLLPRLGDQATAIQQLTGISGDNVTALQAQLAALGVLPQNLEAATVAAVGWSRTTGKDMTAAAVDVVKALNGKTATLEKLGVKLSSAQERLEYMARGMSLAAAEGASLEGRLQILTENWGDLEEAIGGAVTESTAAQGQISALSAVVLQLQQLFASPAGRSAVDTFFRALSTGASLAINAGLGALAFWEDEVLPRVNNARMFFSGQRVISEAIDPDVEEAKRKVRDLAENLANTLASIGKGAAPTLPDVELPALPSVTKQAPDLAAQIAADERAAEQHRKAIEDWIRDEVSRQERVGDMFRRQEEAATAAAARAEAARSADAEAAIRAEITRHEQADALAIEREARAVAAAQRQAATVTSIFQSAAGAIASSWDASFSRVGQVVDGVLVTRSRAFGSFLADIGKRIAEFLASRLVLAFLGVLGNALTGGALGAALSFLGFERGGAVPGFAEGGPVAGGIAGRDSVLIRAMPREYVLNRDTVAAIQAGAPPPPTPGLPLDRYYGAGARVVPVAAGGGATVNLSVHHSSLERVDDARWEDMVERQVLPALRRVLARGGLGLPDYGATG